MTVTISLPPETEQKLRAQAAATGKDVPTIVREAVEEKLAAANAARFPADLPYEQWVVEFNSWVASHKPVGHPVDDSRESIYAGRGE
jgi:hypothetical protein